MALEPGLEPPSGQVSNFDNPDRHMFYHCIAANVTGVAVKTVFMGLRLWARRRLSMRLQADDGKSSPLVKGYTRPRRLAVTDTSQWPASLAT